MGFCREITEDDLRRIITKSKQLACEGDIKTELGASCVGPISAALVLKALTNYEGDLINILLSDDEKQG